MTRRIDRFVEAVRTNDFASFYASLEPLELAGEFAEAFAKLSSVEPNPEFQSCFVTLWIEEGDALRTRLGPDGCLSGLRRLFPRYTGGQLTVYRGISNYDPRWGNRGWSWTSNLQVARQHASRGPSQGIVFAAVAAANAILWRDEGSGLEDEVVVEPVLLTGPHELESVKPEPA